jgi:Zn-finger nucleic acid-binding protein
VPPALGYERAPVAMQEAPRAPRWNAFRPGPSAAMARPRRACRGAEYERERESWMRQSSAPRERYPGDREPYGHRKKKGRFSDLFDIFD